MADLAQINLSQDQEKSVLLFGEKAQQMMMNQFSIRESMTEIDRQYQREKNWTEAEWRARVANKVGDAHKFRDITVPIVMPQVQAALGYMTNVFLTGYPIFGVSASPDQEDAAIQLESIIAENQETAGWARQLMLFFRDGLKYNLHALECEWRDQSVYTVENDLSSPNGAKSKEVIWHGNYLKRLDLYNSFWDYRVAPAEMHIKGEYVGYTELYSRTMFKKYMNDIFGTVTPATAIRALNSTPATAVATTGIAPYVFYMPIINPFPLMLQNNIGTFDWVAWAVNANQKTINYSNVYVVTKLYARIIPADFGMRVPAPNTPQVWKFIIVNGSVVLLAERQSNVHNFIPCFFGQPLEDGLQYQTKSFATNVVDMQEVASAMWNGFIASKRRLVTDRVLYDPLRINRKDINSTNPAAKIPVRPAAYGKPLNEAVYQFPYRDEQANSFLQGAELVTRFADLINGQNPAQQGQFVKGNRTQQEYSDVMGHGNIQNQMMAIMSEAQVFAPLKQCIKLNILQFQQDGAEIYNKIRQQNVKIDQVTLRQAAVQFKVSDGVIPTEKQMNSDEFSVALQVVSQSPQLGQGYNLPQLFTYLMKMKGADLSPFEKSQEQMQYEQALAAWQQAAEMAAKAKSEFKTPMPKPPQPPTPTGQPGQPSPPGAGAQQMSGPPGGQGASQPTLAQGGAGPSPQFQQAAGPS